MKISILKYFLKEEKEEKMKLIKVQSTLEDQKI